VRPQVEFPESLLQTVPGTAQPDNSPICVSDVTVSGDLQRFVRASQGEKNGSCESS